MNKFGVSLEKILEIYLNGGVLKQVESEKDVFISGNELLRLDYEKVGRFPEHTLFEKWHKIDRHKHIKFKVYFFCDKPWGSGLGLWGYRLNFVLKLAKPYIKTINVFFDDTFDYGALIINEFCVFRFDLHKRKFPRMVTLETDKSISEIDKTTMATGWVRMQFSQVKYLNDFPNNKNVQKIFKIIANY